jgi:hypothetical protein
VVWLMCWRFVTGATSLDFGLSAMRGEQAAPAIQLAFGRYDEVSVKIHF